VPDDQFALAALHRPTDQRAESQDLQGLNDLLNPPWSIRSLALGHMIKRPNRSLQRLPAQAQAELLGRSPTEAAGYRPPRPLPLQAGLKACLGIIPGKGLTDRKHFGPAFIGDAMVLFLYLDVFDSLSDRVDNKGVSSFSGSLRGFAAAATRAFKSSSMRMVVVGMRDSCPGHRSTLRPWSP
jgi:hypothetical protein